jgi:hypothetical protein
MDDFKGVGVGYSGSLYLINRFNYHKNIIYNLTVYNSLTKQLVKQSQVKLDSDSDFFGSGYCHFNPSGDTFAV